MQRYFIFLILTTSLIVARVIYVSFSENSLKNTDSQRSISISGVIDDIPVKKLHGVQFVFLTDHHQKILLHWYQPPQALHAGERWQLTVICTEPFSTHNPGLFDYSAFLRTKHIVAVGKVLTQAHSHYLGKAWAYAWIRLRESLVENIAKAVSSSRETAFVSALAVGIRADLKSQEWDILQKTGTNHLIAIAGLHIGFITVMTYALTKKLLFLSPSLLLRMPAARIAESVALILACAYGFLSGLSLPAQRALIMLACFFLSSFTLRNISVLRRFLLAVFLVLVINPWVIFDMSFYLSFFSIAVLMWLMQGRIQSVRGISAWCRMQGGIVIGLIPLMLWFFQQISVVSFFANLVAIPWVGFILLPLILISVLCAILSLHTLSQWGFYLAGKASALLWIFLSWISGFSWASLHFAAPNIFCLCLALIGIFFLLTPRGFPLRFLACSALLPLFFYHPPSPTAGTFRTTVIDVGQGLSVLIQTAHHTMLYDTGAHMPGGLDVGDAIVTPVLRRLKIQHLDRVIISHGDNDHSGGTKAIFTHFSVAAFYSSAPELVVRFHGKACVAGQQWEWDGVHFNTLYPFQGTRYADNNSSCVIRVSSNNGDSLLLTGDIEAAAEKILGDYYQDRLFSRKMLAPHHGSKTSSSQNFLDLVSPDTVIISAGKYNRYHLPSAEVLARYRARHIKVLNTALTGQVLLSG